MKPGRLVIAFHDATLTQYRAETSGSLNWRWACKSRSIKSCSLRLLISLLKRTVYINLPVCAFAFVVLWLSLRHAYVGDAPQVSWSHFGRTFDFVGL